MLHVRASLGLFTATMIEQSYRIRIARAVIIQKRISQPLGSSLFDNDYFCYPSLIELSGRMAEFTCLLNISAMT